MIMSPPAILGVTPAPCIYRSSSRRRGTKVIRYLGFEYSGEWKRGEGADMSGATLVVALVMQISEWGEIHTPSLVARPTPAIRMRPGGGRMQESVEICGLSDVY